MHNQLVEVHQVGVWIDHKEAFLVFNNENSESHENGESHDANKNVKNIVSGMEKHVRYSEHAVSAEGLAEDQRDRRYGSHLDRYYDEVISQMKGATSILIFGPGEAKQEFKKRFETKSIGGRIVGFETTDKLTNPQIVAKVKAYFNKGFFD